MSTLVDSVSDILSRVERRVEASSQNISNVTTPGYKRAVSFESVLDARNTLLPSDDISDTPLQALQAKYAIDVSPGQPMNTDNANDLALLGAGFFTVKSADGAMLYTRQGQFQRDASGRLLNTQGCALQQAGGGDLVLKSGDFKVLNDGTVMQSGEAVGRIAVVSLSDPGAIRYVDGGLYDAPAETASLMSDPSVSQGALEASNVSLGTEMLTIMSALREAQSGQRLMSVYDDLMGRAISTFGQG